VHVSWDVVPFSDLPKLMARGSQFYKVPEGAKLITRIMLEDHITCIRSDYLSYFFHTQTNNSTV
jgi:hypothetical protein